MDNNQCHYYTDSKTVIYKHLELISNGFIEKVNILASQYINHRVPKGYRYLKLKQNPDNEVYICCVDKKCKCGYIIRYGSENRIIPLTHEARSTSTTNTLFHSLECSYKQVRYENMPAFFEGEKSYVDWKDQKNMYFQDSGDKQKVEELKSYITKAFFVRRFKCRSRDITTKRYENHSNCQVGYRVRYYNICNETLGEEPITYVVLMPTGGTSHTCNLG